MRWRSRRVAGSIHDGVIETFHLLNPSGRTGVDSGSNRNEYRGYLVREEGKGALSVGSRRP
jgi:hypothetical protein